jgi:predicted metal-dependent peptidase
MLWTPQTVLWMAEVSKDTKDEGPPVMTEQNVGRRRHGFRTCDSDFNLGRHLIPYLQDVPFYAEISRYVKKRYTHDVPTAAVSFDPRDDQVVMWVNPEFMGGGTYYNEARKKEVTCEPLTNWEIRGTLNHEFDHLWSGHLNARRRTPADDWNVATDLAINSLIYKNAGQPRDLEPGQVARPLPKIALVPGQKPYIDPERFAELDDRSKAATLRRCALIESFPPMKASEWYFNQLQEDRKKNGDDDGGGVTYAIGSMDDHDGWDDIPEELREYVEGKVKGIIERAVRHADSQSDGWGTIPEEIRAEIRRYISNVINWRAVLRQFVGSIIRGARTTSIKRINRRYPYIHPGVKRGYTAKLFIAIDESGSVSDEMCEMFFNELDQLTRKVDITLCHFDCTTGPKDLYEWRKGMRPKLKRTKHGGTNFSAPTEIVNDPKNRGRWDGMLIMTDGQAPKPIPSRIKRGWVLGQGCHLMFEKDCDEIQIFLTKEQTIKGAWR